MRSPLRTIAFLFLAIAGSLRADDFFENQIRPLLERRCIECHGGQKQKGGLRLDHRAGWVDGGDTGPAIVPGTPAESLLIKAVRYTLPDLHMPPKERLPAEEVALLEKWVASGAVDPRDAPPDRSVKSAPVDIEAGRKHWAFQSLFPSGAHNEGVLNPTAGSTILDRFLEEARMREGVRANARADRRTLIRRLAFDLTGLPPTPEEIRGFENDPAPDREAFSRLVEHYLSTRAYAERWARHWLDVARYADTAGDGSDYPVREAGLYRDWVVRAFEKDLPFDVFVRQQIAGDILAQDAPEKEYADLVTATGFLAIGKRYGYRPTPTYQHLDFADVLDSLGRSLLGLSIGCARCHDHKYEPITTADYYALYGILQSTVWAFPGGEEQKRPSQFPSILPPAKTREREAALAEKIRTLDGEIAKLFSEKELLDSNQFGGAADLGFEAQTPGKPPAKPWLSQGPNTVLAEAQSPFVHLHPKGAIGVRVGGKTSGDGIRYVLPAPLKLTNENQIHFSVDFRAPSVSTESKPPGAHRFYLGRGVIQSTAADFSVSADAFAVRVGGNWKVVRRLEPNVWYSLQVRFDGASGMIRGFVEGNGEHTVLPEFRPSDKWDKTIDTFICDGNGHTPGVAPFHDLDNVGLRHSAFPEPGAVVVERKPQTPEQASRLKQLDAGISKITKERDALKETPAYPVAYAVAEGKPVDARIQKRGEPDKAGETVGRRFLSVLGGEPVKNPGASSGRMDLARWITDEHASLTARVFVNRIWQWHFGVGIVPTPSDFGTRGEKPTHPQLLDWLAREFIQSGWSIKAIHRIILNSDAYAMQSGIDAECHARDAANRWLWRFNRFALDAESLRDAMLAVSGQLDLSPAEPHPFPPVSSWKFTIHNPFHAVYESNRRSLYLMIQRNRRHPFLALFDAADPNLSVSGRFATITPSQTLYLMNSPFVAAQARALATRLLSLGAGDAERIAHAFELVHGTKADTDRIRAIEAFLQRHRAEHALNESGVQPVEPPELEAWTALARVLLTSNAFLYVD